MEVLNFCYQFGFLGKSQRRGQITLTFKKVTYLTCSIGDPVDYKIASRAIAGSLLKVHL